MVILLSVREEQLVQTFGSRAWLISQWCEATIWGITIPVVYRLASSWLGLQFSKKEAHWTSRDSVPNARCLSKKHWQRSIAVVLVDADFFSIRSNVSSGDVLEVKDARIVADIRGVRPPVVAAETQKPAREITHPSTDSQHPHPPPFPCDLPHSIARENNEPAKSKHFLASVEVETLPPPARSGTQYPQFEYDCRPYSSTHDTLRRMYERSEMAKPSRDAVRHTSFGPAETNVRAQIHQQTLKHLELKNTNLFFKKKNTSPSFLEIQGSRRTLYRKPLASESYSRVPHIFFRKCIVAYFEKNVDRPCNVFWPLTPRKAHWILE